MALNLVEAAKRFQNPIQSAIVEMFAEGSDVLQFLPFQTIQGGAMRYNREETLPGVGFRGVNEAYSESTGVLNPIMEPLVIAGGDLDVDAFILRTQGEDQRSVQESMKVKALALRWTETFIKGDNATEPREFDGLQMRLTGSQKIVAGATANGTPLSLAKLDELIDAVDNPTALIMNKAMRRRLTTAARTTSVAATINYEQDAFGRRLTQYNDLPILIADQDETGTDILGFTEAASSGTATGTSIYCVSFTEGMMHGIQSSDIMVKDLGELETKPVFRTRVEWDCGIAIKHGKAAARLWSISDAAVTA
jgi:hypothetical protein